MKCSVCRGACCETYPSHFSDIITPIEREWITLRDTPTGACRNLDSHGRCAVYDERPLVCMVFPAGGRDCLAIVKERRTVEQYRAIRDADDPVRL